jgi:myo-inositol 2-dehydrogenase / D-chiro-inositol 1-dehydrogenase
VPRGAIPASPRSERLAPKERIVTNDEGSKNIPATTTRIDDATGASRRTFLKQATAAAVGTSLASRIASIPGAYAAGTDEIRIGLIGCGGRGTGAAVNALNSAPGVKLIAVADAFQDRLDLSRKILKQRAGDKVDIKDDHAFVGLDAYEKLLKTDVNYVILATPPGFRPIHIKAAVAAGKYVFGEKPVCVDSAGARSCLESYEEITKKGLGMVAGTQYRHFVPYIESIKRVQDGTIGKLVTGRCYYNTAGLWSKEREPSWSDLEFQLRNWLYYTWLSGDHLVEQAIHNVDTLVWAFNGAPVRAVAVGGRQTRTEPIYGHIFDHFAIDYEFANGTHCLMMCRQQDGTDKKVANEFVGSKGTAFVLPQYYIDGETPWKLEDTVSTDLGNAYVQEHTDFINSIRAGKPLNELKQVTESSLTAILGREAAYTGKTVTYDEVLNAKQSLMPAKLEFGPMPVPPVPMPGQTTLESA